MAIVSPVRRLTRGEELRYRAGVSESTFQKVGGVVNHIAMRQAVKLDYKLNGRYGKVVTFPILGLEGLDVVPFDIEIVQVTIYNLVAGSSGTTELDIKMATSSGGSFTSIFSTTPKITSAAGANTFAHSYNITEDANGQVWTVNGTPPTGVTVGVLTSVPFNVDANDALRVDLIDRMVNAEMCGIQLWYRPR